MFLTTCLCCFSAALNAAASETNKLLMRWHFATTFEFCIDTLCVPFQLRNMCNRSVCSGKVELLCARMKHSAEFLFQTLVAMHQDVSDRCLR
jgi:hypothetical protein